MKPNFKFNFGHLFSVLSLVLLLQACDSPVSPDYTGSDISERGKTSTTIPFLPLVNAITPTCELPEATYSLTAGQSIPVGQVVVDRDGDELSLTFTTSGNWSITETHIQIDTVVPVERGAPGRYTNGTSIHSPSVSSFTRTYSLSALGLTDGSTIYIRAHAVVKNSVTGASETAFGGDIQSPRGAWYGIMGYQVTTLDCAPTCQLTGNYFPQWPQDISHVTLVFDTDAGMYSVKIDGFDSDSKDLDDSIDTILTWLVDNDSRIDEDYDLLGSTIKGGRVWAAYFSYGCHDTNGIEADELPTGVGFTLTGAWGNETPGSAINKTYQYSDIF